MFDKDIGVLRGVGDARKKLLHRLGINTLGDMLYYFPRGLEDRAQIREVHTLQDGETAAVQVFAVGKIAVKRVRGGLTIYTQRFVDETGTVYGTWYNNPYVQHAFHENELYSLYGKVSTKYNRRDINAPVFEAASAGRTVGRIVPVYHLTADLSQKILASLMEQCLALTKDNVPETLPFSIRQKYALPEIKFALQNIHFPADFESYALAKKRFIFEEFFLLQAGLRLLKKREQATDAQAIAAQPEAFYKLLPFTPTNAQKRAVEEIYHDLRRRVPMNRLLQGDVGSGKTAVAAGALYAAAANGMQGILMAPTEILAKQHFAKLSSMFPMFSVCLLTGNMGVKAKRAALAAIADGTAQIIIGTHALIEEDVAFQNASVMVTDEQHRFGVQQRTALSRKGQSPHLLVMSATPIPRTLSLILYGDLDVSVIDELPPHRQTVDTFTVGEEMRRRVYTFVKKETDKGNRAYVVCPLVEESDTSELKSVVAFAEDLKKLFGDDVLFIHGKMKDKDEIMARFAAGEGKVLVSTTVIEVGVDVADATVMVIENAERFGLSQLHQLRGRVGRGSAKSYCILFCNGGSDVTRARMKIMTETNDGFKIAEKDLELRGPGEFFGTRQHGLPELRIANIFDDMEVLKLAGTAVDTLLRIDPTLADAENQNLKMRITAMFRAVGALN